MAFEDFGVMPELIRAVEDLGWTLPTPIQAEAIPLILGGGDVMAAAETGSGKTGAFALPLLQIVYETQREAAIKSNPTAGGTSVRDKLALSSTDRDPAMAVSTEGLVCQSRAETWQGIRATVGVQRGKYYYEVSIRDEGLCRVGWSTRAAKLDLGTDKQGFGFGGTGKKSFGRQFDTYGEPFGKGDVIGCFIDFDEGTIHFSKNGKQFQTAFQIPNNLRNFAFYPAAVVKNAEMAFNFGATPFAYPPGNSYRGLASADISDTTLAGGGAASVAAKPGRPPLALILEPSRELALQTHEAILSFQKYLPEPKLTAVLISGGEPPGKQLDALKCGVDIVTGTPGRLIDFAESGKLDLSQVIVFVLDEADRLLLDKEGYEGVMKLYSRLPKQAPVAGGRRPQGLMFSATLHSPEVAMISEKIFRFPTWVDLKGKDFVPTTVDHCYVAVDPRKDTSYLSARVAIRTDGIHARAAAAQRGDLSSDEGYSEAIKRLKGQVLLRLIDKHQMDQAIIFVRTRLDAANLEEFLRAAGAARGGKPGGPLENPYSCMGLHGDRRPEERRRNLQAFKDGEFRFLICTDVAARGIDITGLPYVINYTLPDTPDDYIHRVGRVGRAERIGLAISLVGMGREKVWYHTCPSKGKNCTNTALREHGGCAIWWDEPQYLKDIEKRLGAPVPHVDADMRHPFQRKDYGQLRDGGNAVVAGHLEQLRPTVQQLAILEDAVQKSFLGMKLAKWNVKKLAR